MAKKYNVAELKELYIGKSFNHLTVIDVIENNSHVKLVCKCVCGKIKQITPGYVLHNKTISCGCIKSELAIRRSEHLKAFWAAHPELAAERGKKVSKWYTDNPDLAREKFDRQSQFYKDHPEFIENRASKYSQWCKDNPDEVAKKAAKYSEWAKSNPDKIADIAAQNRQWRQDNQDKVSEISQKISSWYADNPELSAAHTEHTRQGLFKFHKAKRASCDYSKLLEVLRPDQHDSLLRGEIKSGDFIFTKCPRCNEYGRHLLNKVYRLSIGDFTKHVPPLCADCTDHICCSSYEYEIESFISTFYSGECIRNTRDIISPLELDLYYPEKKIAIEFNGDYWHSDEFKSDSYHYDKFKKCYDLDIVLVSIFESRWFSTHNEIKNYLIDLFSDTRNKLSFHLNEYMNNNYPLPMPNSYNIGDVIADSYKRDGKGFAIHTCGFSKLI